MKLRKDPFFAKMDRLGLSLAYSEVRMKSGYSDTDPVDASIQTLFSRNVPMNCPIVSAAMDTITEAPMAITLAAKFGGLGIIHKNLTPAEQVSQVRKVKLYLNCRIDKPICVNQGETIGEILARRRDEGFTFHSFPVIDSNGKVVGLLTSNDFDLCDSNGTKAVRAMTPLRDLITGPANLSAEKAHSVLKRGRKKVLPLLSRDGGIAGMYVLSDLHRLMSGKTSECNVDEDGHLRVGAAIDVGPAEVERAEMLLSAGCDVIVVDKAHGDMKPVRETLIALKNLRQKFPGRDIVVGNISEAESAKRLVSWGADGIKIGQGPGSICTTRDVAGIGNPQVTAVYECAKAIRGSGIPVCADGGITKSGDIPIAIGLGASSVMLGFVLAGTDETPGEIKETKKGRVKVYRGMGSLEAMKENAASRARYRQQNVAKEKLVAEGVVSVVPYKGAVAKELVKMVGGLRAGLGYVGAASIAELQKKADFRYLTPAGQAESHPHDVTVTDETQ